MNMEKFLHFFIKHNALLIEAMIALILIASGFLAYRSFKNSRDEETGGPVPDMSNLEDALKKIIEKANQIPAQPAAAGAASGGTQAALAAGSMSSAEAASLANEITKLKLELEKKQAEIEAMKKSGSGATATEGGLSSEEKTALNTQINELKRKLEEYDIISADIADLSFYKEENARLQKELAAKGSASAPAQPAKPTPAATPTTAPQAPAPTAAPAAETIPSSPQTVAQAPVTDQPVATTVSGASPTSNSEITAVTSAAPPPEAPIAVTGQIPPTESPEHAVENVIDDDIMKDFAAAVADQGGTDLSEIEIPQIDPITAESIEGTKQTVPPEAPAMPSIDIPAIGEEKAQVKPTEGDGANPLGSLDLDKMASEVVALPDATQVDGQVDSLSGTMDPEKLAQEASTLTASGVKPEDKELMGKFENFVKKEKT